VTRCRQDGNHLASFGINCVSKLYNNIDITLDIVIITSNINILEFSYQMLRKLYCGLRYDYSFILMAICYLPPSNRFHVHNIGGGQVYYFLMKSMNSLGERGARSPWCEMYWM